MPLQVAQIGACPLILARSNGFEGIADLAACNSSLVKASGPAGSFRPTIRMITSSVTSWPIHPSTPQQISQSPGEKLASKNAMPTKTKSSGQPIYDRLASTLPKPSGTAPKPSLDSEADDIRKAWLQNSPARSK